MVFRHALILTKESGNNNSRSGDHAAAMIVSSNLTMATLFCNHEEHFAAISPA